MWCYIIYCYITFGTGSQVYIWREGLPIGHVSHAYIDATDYGYGTDCNPVKCDTGNSVIICNYRDYGYCKD